MVASSGLTSASADFVRNKPAYKVLNLDDIIRMSQQAEQIIQNNMNIQTEPKTLATKGRKVDI